MLDYTLDFIMGRFIYCPRCLKRLPLRAEATEDMTCEGCQYLIPLVYITGCQKAPPVFVQVFGLPGSGKTTFLDMLSLFLHDMDHVWQESAYYSRPLTQQTMEHTTTLLTKRRQGVLAQSTPRRTLQQTEVLIFHLRGMPRWGSRTLVIMDHAGEQFAQLNLDLGEIPFLQHTPITILLLSLDDLTNAGKRVDDLITSYLNTLKMYRVHLARQHRQLIIAFSKADLLTDLPPELSSYLSSDTAHFSLTNHQGHSQLSEGQLQSYLQRMQRTSDTLRNWVMTLPSGISMLNMLADQGVETRFALISATGSPLTPTPGGSALAPRPRRVLDPFFWVLEYYRRRGSRSTVPATLRSIQETFSPALRSAWSLIILALTFAGSLLAGIFLARLSGDTSDLVRPGLALLILLVYLLAIQWLTRAGPRSVKNQPTFAAYSPIMPSQEEDRPDAPTPVGSSVLTTSRLALFFACLAASSVPAVRHVLAHLTLSQFLQIFLVVASLFSCFQPSTRMAASSRITLAIMASCGALLQYSYGVALEFQGLHLPLASLEIYTAITNSIVLMLLILAGILLLILATGRNGWDRFMLWLVVLVFAGLQLVYGPWEILQLFPWAGQSAQMVQQVELVNMILAALLILLPPPVMFYLHRFTYLDRLPLLILAIACAVQLHFLGDGATLPAGVSLPLVPIDVHLLTTPVVSFLTPSYLLAYTLLVLIVLIAIRWLFGLPTGPFVFIDHAVLFFLALLCAQFQSVSWGAPVPQGLLSPIQTDLLITNHILASLLTIQVYLGAGLALLLLLLPLTRQIKRLPWLLRPLSDRFAWLLRQSWCQRALNWLCKPLIRLRTVLPWSRPQTVHLTLGIPWLRSVTAWLRRVLAWLLRVLATLDTVMYICERILICTTTLACALLADLYGQIGSGTPALTIAGSITINQLGALLFVILAIVILRWIKSPLARGSRFLLLLNLILCMFLYLGRGIPALPLVSALRHWSAAASRTSLPILIFISLCSATALISFWWAERSPFPGDRRLLQILFALALIGGFLQLQSSTLLVTLLALQTLIIGMAIAAIGTRSHRA